MLIIIGASGVGKTTLARAVAAEAEKEEDVQVVSAGGWVRAETGIYEHTPEARAQLEVATRELLGMDPEWGRRWLRAQTTSCRPVIVEGLRIFEDYKAITHGRDHLVVELVCPEIVGGVWERRGVAQIARDAPNYIKAFRQTKQSDYDSRLCPNLVPDLASRLLTLWRRP